MKRLLLCAALVIASLNLGAQVHNFNVTNEGKIYWQKIFEDDGSPEAVIASILSSGSYSGILESESLVSFHIDYRPVDVTALGYRRMAVPIYTVNYDFSGQATIQFQEGRYRVTVQDIILADSEGTAPIEGWAVNRGQMTRNFAAIPSELYDKYLSGLFGPKDSPLDNDW
jgi:hypothetical protein